MKEIWKDIPKCGGLYQVSNLGRVKSLDFKRTGKEGFLKLSIGLNGYNLVTLSYLGKGKTYRISKLVAIVFLNHKPNGFKTVVDHINNIKTDDRLENLQVITQRENCSKDKKNGTSKYTGVSWNKKDKKWQSGIKINGISINLGYFNNEEEASKAYQNKLKTITL